MSDKANWQGTTQVEEGNIQFTGTLRVDGGSKFVIVDPTDSTKSVIFNVSGLPTGTQTEFTVPDSDSSLVTLTATQTLTNKTLTNPTVNAAAGVVVVPTAASPAQTTEGSVVWDSDDDLLTVGDGSARKILVDTTSTQTLSAKTLTNPTVNAGSGVVVLPAAASPAQTAEGSIVWDSDDDLLTVGDGSARKVMCDTTTAQTLTNKTLTAPALTAPTVSTSLLVTSTTGAIGVPVMTEAQRDALTPAAGWLIYNSTTNKLNIRVAAAWEVITSA